MSLPTKQVQVQEASNPSKVKVYGPAVDQPCKTFHPTYFMVDCSEAGPGEYRYAIFDWPSGYVMVLLQNMVNFMCNDT